MVKYWYQGGKEIFRLKKEAEKVLKCKDRSAREEINLCDMDGAQGNHVQKVDGSYHQPHPSANRVCL